MTVWFTVADAVFECKAFKRGKDMNMTQLYKEISKARIADQGTLIQTFQFAKVYRSHKSWDKARPFLVKQRREAGGYTTVGQHRDKQDAFRQAEAIREAAA